MCNASFLNSTCVLQEKPVTLSSSICIVSSFILTFCIFAGTGFNFAALYKIFSRYQQWRTKVPLIQLLLVSIVVNVIFSPFELFRIWLGWSGHEFLLPCSVYHFFQIHADSCCFVTTVMITYDRVQKINKIYPVDVSMNHKRCTGLCSWLLIFPLSIYLVFRDHNSQNLSLFMMTCTVIRPTTPDTTSLAVTSILFLFSFLLVSVLYFVGMRTFLIQSKTSSGNTELQESVNKRRHDANLCPSRRLSSPINITKMLSPSSINNESSYYTSSNNTTPSKKSDINEGLIPTKVETVSAKRKKLKKHSMKRTQMNESKSDDDFDNGSLNPLRHTRLSAGNTWNESDSSKSSKQSIANSNNRPMKKRKKMKKKRNVKMIKKASADSTGKFSFTSQQSTTTNSEIGSESSCSTSDGHPKTQILMTQCEEKISIILEQSECDKETVSLRSMKSVCSDCKTTKYVGISGYCVQHKQSSTVSIGNSTLPVTSSGGHSNSSKSFSLCSFENKEGGCPSRIDDKSTIIPSKLIHVKAAQNPKISFDVKSNAIHRKSKSEELLGSTLSNEDEDERLKTNKIDRNRSKSFALGTSSHNRHRQLISLTTSNFKDWNEHLNKVGPFRLSSSMINLKAKEIPDNPVQKTFQNSETQTDNKFVITDEDYGGVPAIRIIRPSVQGKQISPSRLQLVRPMLVKQIAEETSVERTRFFTLSKSNKVTNTKSYTKLKQKISFTYH